MSIIKFNLRPHSLKPNIYVGEKLNFSKKKYEKLEIKFIFSNFRRRSNKLSFETVFVEIGCEFYLRYHLESAADKNAI